MKRRLLIVLAIAALLSLTVLAACDTHEHKWSPNHDDLQHWQECECGDKKDVANHAFKPASDGKSHWQECECGAVKDKADHELSWKSDAANHWQECDSCNFKSTSAAHVDVKNNETQAEGADGKCDVCAHEIFAVIFDMQGHGKAVEPQNVGKGGKATAPQAPANDDAWKFGGWYKESGCINEFDFSAEVINEATTVYAKWTEDTTEGASKAHAYVLTLGQENYTPAKVGETVYYKFAAEVSGRYMISLSGLNSANGTFTTNLTADAVYGKDCDLEEIAIDIDAYQTLYIAYVYSGEAGEDISVSPLVTEVTDEPLPADLFPSGEYANATYSFEFDRETKQITDLVYDWNTIAKYIGGKYNKLLFERSMDLGGTIYTTKYSLTPNDDGDYVLSIEGASSTSILQYVVPQDPVALSEIAGLYVPADADKTTANISELYIFASDLPTSTLVRMKNAYDYSDFEIVYNTEKNSFSFYSDMIVVTLNIDSEGGVESINLNGVKYVLKSALGKAPKNLELAEDAEYLGENHTVKESFGTIYLDSNSLTVLEYAQESGIYTVSIVENDEFKTYKLTLSSDGKTITLSDESNTLIETLVKFEWVLRDLPVQQATLQVQASDFQKGFVVYTVKQAGWYVFSDIPAEGVIVYYRLNDNDYTETYYAKQAENAQEIYLAVDSHVGIYMETPADVSVSIAPASAPEGTEQSKPKQIADGSVTMDVAGELTYYFTYTAPEAGHFLVRAYYNGVEDNCRIMYSINGTNYGYVSGVGEWMPGMSYDNPVAKVQVSSDNLVLNIQIYCSEDWETITFVVSQDYSAEAEELTLSGTPDGNSLTVTATADTGTAYHIASSKGQSIAVTGSAAFTIKMQGGGSIVAQEVEGVYTATIAAGTNLYFKPESDTQQQLTLTQTFEKGSEGYPVEPSFVEGVASLTVGTNESLNITLPVGIYVVASDSNSLEVLLNGENVSIGSALEIKEGDILSLINHNRQAVAELTVSELKEVFSKDQVGTYTAEKEIWGSQTTITLTFDRFGAGIYNNGVEFNITITEKVGGGYTFSYAEGEQSVEFVIEGGKVKIVDSDDLVGSVELVKQASALNAVYVGTITGPGGNFDVEVTIKDGKITYRIDSGSGFEYEATQKDYTANGDTYEFLGDFGDSHSIVISADGNTAVLTDGYRSASGTLTKQA